MPASWPQPAVLENLLQQQVSPEDAESDDGPGTTTKKNDDDDDDRSKAAAPSAPTTVEYDHRVLALYKFVSPRISEEDLPALKRELEEACRRHSARGTLLIAEEGVNGTICYPFGVENGDDDDDESRRRRDDPLLSFLQAKFDGSLRTRVSPADRPVFARLKIKIKSEIVTMDWKGDESRGGGGGGASAAAANGTVEACARGDRGCDSSSAASPPPPSCGPCRPTERAGEYVRPRDWNKLLMDPDTLVIDTRNEYEITVGTFRNAVNPHTQSFVEFPDWIKRNLVEDGRIENDDADADANTAEKNKEKKNDVEKKKKIAMFCTGGIRCEKATNAAMQLIPGDTPVYHLEGGILAYLDEVPEKEGLFDGDCYVFDQRVAVTYKNRPSETFRQKCHACRYPLSNQDLERDDYRNGSSCRHCVGQLTGKQEERFAQRQRQMELALNAGRRHIHDAKEQMARSETKKLCMR